MSAERILVLGASGMLGHEAMRVLAPDFEVWGACRNPADVPDVGVPRERILGGLDATRVDSAEALIDRVKPTLVLNAVGIVKHLAEADQAIPSIQVNSLWPHVLAAACERADARMVHVSTDCVFSGSRGGYVETDVPDAFDRYGRSKLLGEVIDRENTITLRTSIIGWQSRGTNGLMQWFATHRHEKLKGFTGAVFSGLTTQAFTEVVRDVVMTDPSLWGLWHLSAEPIDKDSLLRSVAEHMGWDVDITPSGDLVINRSLDSSAFRRRTGWTPPSWDQMLTGLAASYTAQKSTETRVDR